MRRSLASWIIVPVVTTVVGGPAVAGIDPPPPHPLPRVEFHTEVFGDDCYVTRVGDETVTIGRAAEWTNDEEEPHTFLEENGFWSITLDGGETFEGAAQAAGSFSQSCDLGPFSVGSSWSIRLKARAHPATPDFKVTWAIPSADVSWHYNVEYRVGSRSWRTWYADTAIRSATFDGVNGRTYSFRSRVIDSETKAMSWWSRVRKVFT